MPHVLFIIMILIVVGGLGFLVLEELRLRFERTSAKSRQILSLHIKLVLSTSSILIGGGWLLFTTFELNVGFGDMDALEERSLHEHYCTNGRF